MKDYKLLFLKTIAPVNQSLKEDVNFTVFDVALAVRGGNDQKQNILQGAPKVAAVELQVSTQLLETQSDVEQKKGMRPLLKTQNYPRIITSKYIQKNNKSTLCASNQQKNQNLQLSTFFLFLCCCNGVSHPFFFPQPQKTWKTHTFSARQYDIRSRDLVCYLLFGIIIAPFQVPTRWVPRCLGDPGKRLQYITRVCEAGSLLSRSSQPKKDVCFFLGALLRKWWCFKFTLNHQLFFGANITVVLVGVGQGGPTNQTKSEFCLDFKDGFPPTK